MTLWISLRHTFRFTSSCAPPSAYPSDTCQSMHDMELLEKRRRTMVPAAAAGGCCAAFTDTAAAAENESAFAGSVGCYAKTRRGLTSTRLAGAHGDAATTQHRGVLVLQWLDQVVREILRSVYNALHTNGRRAVEEKKTNPKVARNTRRFPQAAEMINNQY